MGRSQETFSKKEREKKKRKKKQDKLEKKLERKANANKGRPLEEMFSYVDAYGNLTSTPPDQQFKPKVKAEDILISVPKKSEEPQQEPDKGPRSGKVTYFDESKGYGFIKDDKTQESVFVHVNQMIERVSESQRVTFTVEHGPKGVSAVNVKAAD